MNEAMTGKDLANEICNTLNNFNSKKDREEFVEQLMRQHRTLQQQAMGLFLKAIEAYAETYKNGYYDLRNEASTKLCHKMVEAFGEEFHMPFI